MTKPSRQIAVGVALLFCISTVHSFQTAIPPRVCKIAFAETGLNFCGVDPRGDLSNHSGQVCDVYTTHPLAPDQDPETDYLCETKGTDQVFFSCESASLQHDEENNKAHELWEVLKHCYPKDGVPKERCPLEGVVGGKLLTDCCSNCNRVKLRPGDRGDGDYKQDFFDWRTESDFTDDSSSENEKCYAEFAKANGVEEKTRYFSPVQAIEETQDSLLQAERKEGGAPTLVAKGKYCSHHKPLGTKAHGFGFTLEGCAKATQTTDGCSGTYFYWAPKYHGQCKCATDDCTKRGSSSAHNIYMQGAGRQQSRDKKVMQASAVFEACKDGFEYCESEEQLVDKYEAVQRMIYPCVAKSLFPDGIKSENADIKKVVADITESLHNRFDAREKEENEKLKEAECISPWKKCVEGATCCQPAHQPGCYVKAPSGCRKNPEFSAPDFKRDTDGETHFNAAKSKWACLGRRKWHYTNWCGAKDIQMKFVGAWNQNFTCYKQSDKYSQCRPSCPGKASSGGSSSSSKKLKLKGKAATQSSTGWGGKALRAIDGRINGKYFAKSCTHTKKENRPWWQVDLGKQTEVQKVVVWNRVDCCQNRLNNFDVVLDSNNICGSVGPAQRKNTVSCSGKKGQKVKVQLQGKGYLTLAEVEVYGAQTGSGEESFEELIQRTRRKKWACAADVDDELLSEITDIDLRVESSVSGWAYDCASFGSD